MASAWLFKYVLIEDLDRYETEGWVVVGPGPNLGGWLSVLVQRKV